MKKILFLVFVLSWFSSFGQKTIEIVDENNQVLVGTTIYNISKKESVTTPFDTKVILPKYPDSDTIKISRLGYESVLYLYKNLPEKIILHLKSQAIREVTITPITARDYIIRSADSFKANIPPFTYKQNVFFREEWIESGDYFLFQEMDIDLYQFPKTGDKRKYYNSSSYPYINRFYSVKNHKKMEDIKSSFGKLISKNMDFNELTLYANVKGANFLNLIYSILLEDPNDVYDVVGDEILQGTNTIHIKGTHYFKKTYMGTSHIYLEANSLAVVAFSFQSTDEEITNKMMDFTTKVILKLLGIKIKIKQYYAKALFLKNESGFWTLSDFLMMFPMSVTQKKTVDGYVSMMYRVDPKVTQAKLPMEGKQIYKRNTEELNKPSGARFAKEMKYGIPLSPNQEKRLQQAINFSK